MNRRNIKLPERRVRWILNNYNDYSYINHLVEMIDRNTQNAVISEMLLAALPPQMHRHDAERWIDGRWQEAIKDVSELERIVLGWYDQEGQDNAGSIDKGNGKTV